MRRPMKTLFFALAIAAAATTAAAATNPLSRDSQHDSFYYGAMNGQRSRILPSSA